MLLFIAAGVGTASGQDSQALRIRVLDYAGLPAAVLQDFDSPARDLFSQAGIDVEWRVCRVAADQGSCEPLRDSERFLKVVRDAPGREGAMVFGTTIRDGKINRFAYVFWDRVQDAARRNGVSSSLLLAHVMAHEVGHLFGLEHSPDGLMRRQFAPADLLRAVQGRLRFTDREGGIMRTTLVRWPTSIAQAGQ